MNFVIALESGICLRLAPNNQEWQDFMNSWDGFLTAINSSSCNVVCESGALGVHSASRGIL